MMSILVKRGVYKNKSEMVRQCIERDYTDKIKDPREELKKEKKRLEEIVKELESLTTMKDKALDDILDRYQDRKNNMPVKSLANYEQLSKNWIERNMDEIAELFPDKDVNDIYKELETLIKKGEQK